MNDRAARRSASGFLGDLPKARRVTNDVTSTAPCLDDALVAQRFQSSHDELPHRTNLLGSCCCVVPSVNERPCVARFRDARRSARRERMDRVALRSSRSTSRRMRLERRARTARASSGWRRTASSSVRRRSSTSQRRPARRPCRRDESSSDMASPSCHAAAHFALRPRIRPRFARCTSFSRSSAASTTRPGRICTSIRSRVVDIRARLRPSPPWCRTVGTSCACRAACAGSSTASTTCRATRR